MKQTLIFFTLLILSYSAYSQKYITLKNETSEINNRKFYIENVIDRRHNKKDIGEIWNGTFKKTEKIDIEGGLQNAVENYFRMNFPKTSENQVKVDTHIKYLQVKQGLSETQETGSAHIVIEFTGSDGMKFETKADIYDEVENAFLTHEERIRRGFYECTVKFNNVLKNEESENIDNYEDAVEIIFDDGNNEDVNEKTYTKKEKNITVRNRNIIAIGYNIGGITLLGADYEIRLHDYFGVHFGAGLIGFTGGVKIHTSKRKNSMVFNVSWKDTGLGLMNGLGIELGGRWIWIKSKDIGLLYQAGIFILNNIDYEFEYLLYKNSAAPPVSLSMGIGLSW